LTRKKLPIISDSDLSVAVVVPDAMPDFVDVEVIPTEESTEESTDLAIL
jgi:hypothetical protein